MRQKKKETRALLLFLSSANEFITITIIALTPYLEQGEVGLGRANEGVEVNLHVPVRRECVCRVITC